MSEKLEGLLTATDTAVVELEELQGIIAEGQERGFLTPRRSPPHWRRPSSPASRPSDLLSYLEEHGIEIARRRAMPRPNCEAHDGRRNGA